jgi:multidrug resistance protein, MATE family
LHGQSYSSSCFLCITVNNLSNQHHIKTNFLLAYPVMISMLGQVMTGVADSVMVGWIGALPLAASSFANIFFTLPLFFGVGVSYAITPLVAEAHGAKNTNGIIETLRNGLLINMLTGIALVALIFAIEPTLYMMSQPPEVVTLAIPYLKIVGLSIIPTMLFQTFRQFAEGLHKTRMAMVIVIVSNLLNIALNYVLIYGVYGFPEMGLNGAGLATLISRIVMGVWMAAYIYYGKDFRAYRAAFPFQRASDPLHGEQGAGGAGGYSKSLINKMLHIGVPAGTQFLFEAGAFGFSAVMMGWIGTTALAAHQIAINLATISYMTTSGLGAAATIRVAHFLGQRDIPTLRRVGFLMIAMAAVIMAAWAILFITGKHFLPELYIRDAAVLQMAAPLMIIAGFFQLSDGMQVVCAGALRGLQDVKIPSILIFVAYWIIALPLGYWLAFPLGYGANGIWIGLLIGLTITATLMIVRFNLLSKKI